MTESVPRPNVNRDFTWWFKFTFACLAAGFGGWLLLATLAMPLLGNRLFDQPYQGLIDIAFIAVCAPFFWRRLK